jgi:acetylornithine/succinyldiaminopimelate/putrescine aminotransferase
MEARSLLAGTYDQILREQAPNLFRLFLNPYVVQTCFCLERYVQDAWAQRSEPFQTFLANSFDEALSGAIKLARYCASVYGKPTTGLVIDLDDRLGPFASASVAHGKVVFLPGLVVVRSNADVDAVVQSGQSFGFVVLMPGALNRLANVIGRIVRENHALLIISDDRASLARIRRRSQSAINNLQSAIPPDIVVFDESFVRRDVPFGAFTARQSLYDHWNTSAKSTFHSTTFQPNTIASLHFMRCLELDDPEFHATLADDLRQIEMDVNLRKTLFRRLYSPSLAKAIAATGFDTPNVRAAGDFVLLDGLKVFDGVSGVACSVRGHNPSTYATEMDSLAGADCEAEVADRLRDLTGLDCMVPAVSGASAVEIALKVGLVAQFPRRHVLALKAGFGGKTLFALTGTWNTCYKEHIDPLYADVLFVDPFAPDAIAQIDAALAVHDVALVQAELIQGVGGVRRVPEAVIRHLAAGREKHGYLLLFDEVQTGMHRTGPFTLSRELGLTPDLLVVGKAVSDMMFPFALLLYSAHVQTKLDQAGSDLPDAFRKRHAYMLGYKTVLNVLRFAEQAQLAKRVTEAGALFERLLTDELADCKAVRAVRVYGLLIGIELDATRWPRCWVKKRLFWFYLAAMLKHPRYPVLVGFCQYEPNVLKITPPLTVDAAQIRQVCATIGAVLRRPFYQLLASAVGSLVYSFAPWRTKHDHAEQSAHVPVFR